MIDERQCRQAVARLFYNNNKDQRDFDLILELINEHFNNSLGFKAFKLPSDSTLKSFNKDELIDYIHMLYENWKSADNFYERVVKENEKLVKENDSLTTQLLECQRVCKVKQERIEELSRVSTQENSNPPLKFEDLKGIYRII